LTCPILKFYWHATLIVQLFVLIYEKIFEVKY
jgi:hypothetical protein